MSWTEDLPEKFTAEDKTLLSKFETSEAAHTGYVELQRSAGKPFKLPESLDKLPDDTVRADFTSKIGTLLGKDISSVMSKDELEDINFAEGLSDARMLHPDLKKEITKWAIDGKVSKSQVKTVAQMINKFIMGFVNIQDADKANKATEVLDSLKTLFGGDDGVKRNRENVHRMFMNHAGLTTDEYSDAVKAIIDSGMNQDTAISKALFNLAKPFAESKTEVPGAPAPKKKEGEESDLKEQMPKTGKALGWK